MKRCLLNRRSEAVMSIITSILNVTLKCQALIRRGDPASLASALRSRSEFHSHVGFLYLVLTKLVKRGFVYTFQTPIHRNLTRLSQIQHAPRGHFIAS